MNHWHYQSYPDTCAIASQEFILESVTGQDFDETSLRDEATARGWYSTGGGTPLSCVGNLLDLHGIPNERHYNATWKELTTELNKGNKVLVSVDADELYSGGVDVARDEWYGDAGYIAGQGNNHIVQVSHVDTSDPGNPLVVLNDPGSPYGCGLTLPLEKYANAWADSNNYMCHTVASSEIPTDTTSSSSMDLLYQPTAAPQGAWEQSYYSGCFYERAPDGSYTGNWSR